MEFKDLKDGDTITRAQWVECNNKNECFQTIFIPSEERAVISQETEKDADDNWVEIPQDRRTIINLIVTKPNRTT